MDALDGIEAYIAYTPMKGEADYRECETLVMKLGTAYAFLPQDRTEDPFAWAKLLTERFKGKKVAILIPGSRFDMVGTRHGRGGGWYDRFLSEVPKEWLRIGVAYAEQISEKPLKREEWDEPIAHLLVKTKVSWKLNSL